MTLDHLVYATPNVAESVRHIAGLTGVWPAEGGRHTGGGTRNFLLGLGGLRYLEIVGPDPDQPEPARPLFLGLGDLTAPRLVTWAARADDIDAQVARARLRGYDPGPVEPMSRKTPTGETVSWRLTRRPDTVVPFLIDWGTTPHPARNLPVAMLTSFTGSHPDPVKAKAALAALGVELPVSQGEPGLVAVIGDAVLR
jgi:glyoxalase-like protein